MFEDDGLPKNICEICLDQLDEAYSFRQQILLTDEKLRLQTSTVIKTEKEEWIKLENEDDITYVEITDNYENSESLSLEDIFQVQLCEEVDNIDNEKVILTKNKSKERPDKQKPGKSLTRVCPECGRLLKRDSYTDHMLTQHSKEFKIECEICGEKLKTKRILWHHKKTKHEDREKVSCDKCGLIFSTRNTFSRHYNTVHLGMYIKTSI